MLVRLLIENVALIQRQELLLDAGLTIISGETGAGKSLLLDALGLVLGERADAGLVRTGSQRALVQATFHLPPGHPIHAWLREHALDHPEEALYLRRVVGSNGRGQAFVNETAVPVATLKSLGDQLVDLHGQHEHQSLLNPAIHLEILDAFAGAVELADRVKAAYTAWRARHDDLAAMRAKAREASQQREFLAFQAEELAAAGVREGELEELEGRRGRLAHAARLAEAAQGALALLAGDGAAALTSRAAAQLEHGATWDPVLGQLAGVVRSLHYELAEAAARLEQYGEEITLDPEELAELEERIDLLRRLARKHRCEADQLPVLLAEWRAELQLLDTLDQREEGLQAELALAAAAYDEAARQLSAARRAAAGQLETAVEKEVKGLHMGGARFAVALQEQGDGPRPRGLEEAAFQVSANAGEPLKPLRLVASGGEMARLMLAIKGVLADASPVPTLVFDEVDVGVGGRTAAAIGARLRQVAARRQVLAITHLPQVAAWGGSHWAVEKQSQEGRTRVEVRQLTGTTRVEELARMLAGDDITASARRHAKELLTKAQGL